MAGPRPCPRPCPRTPRRTRRPIRPRATSTRGGRQRCSRRLAVWVAAERVAAQAGARVVRVRLRVLLRLLLAPRLWHAGRRVGERARLGPTEHCRKKCLALDAILRRLHRSAVVGAVIAPIALACRGGEPFSRSGHGREPGAQGTRAGGETVMVEAVALVPVARLGVARGVALSIAEQRRHAIVGTWFLPVQAHAHTRRRRRQQEGGLSGRSVRRRAPCPGSPDDPSCSLR